jgi:small nuclear ribonucleoprotein (snRNP)-like protein
VRRDRLLREALRERFVVTLTSGETFDGLLDETDESTVTLVDADALAGDGSSTKVDGALYLPRARIAYMQHPDRRSAP